MQEDPADGSGASVRTLEIATALLFLLVGAVVMWDSARKGAGWGADGPQSGYFPFYVGLLMCIASFFNLWRGFRMNKTESFVSRPQLKLVLSIFLPFLAYLAAMQWLGIYVASFGFISLFMIWQGKFSLMKSGVTAACVVVLLFVMFEIWFKVPLIKGPLEALLGY